MSNITMTNDSEAMKQIMQILGIDKISNIISFTLIASVDKLPRPKNIITNAFDLVIKK